MPEHNLARTKEILIEQERKYRSSTRNWKVGYRALLVSAAFLASSAAIAAKLKFLDPGAGEDISAILAGGAAVLTTLLAAQDFDSNFHINRKSQHQIQALMLDIEKTDAEPNRILDELKKIVLSRTIELNKS